MTLEIPDLGLTRFQINEVSEADPVVVAAWLMAASEPEIRSPTGFFLTGLRSGTLPSDDRPERAHVVLLAERWIERVGLLYDREEDVLDELFNQRGLLRQHNGDMQLQARLMGLWRRHRPLGEQVEREQVERAERNAATYFALKEVDDGSASDLGRA